MAYHIAGPVGFQPIADTSTTKNHPLGRVVSATDDGVTLAGLGSGEFIYLKGIASTVVGSMVDYDQYLGTTALSPATGGIGPVAVAMSANVANQFAWYQICGTAAVKCPTSVVGGEVFMLAATPGSVSSADVANETICNAKFTTLTGTPAAGLALMQINRPSHQGQID